MKLPQLFCLALCFGPLLVPHAVAQEQTEGTCSLQRGWKPTTDELDQILLLHRHWTMLPRRLRNWSDPERANLCNADLSFVKLDNADLRGAELNRARLRWAWLNRADLRWAKLENASLHEAELNYADLREAELKQADLSFANLHKADLREAKLNKADLREAKLNEANLRGVELNKAKLRMAELNYADLREAKLNEARLSEAKLNDANLGGAELTQADLSKAELNKADLSKAELSKADLSKAKLRRAIILSASVDGAQLAYADLTDAIYAPTSAPPNFFVAGIKGLETVTFPSGEEVGLVQFRELLQKAGLRDLEREATFAIENGKTVHALNAWSEKPLKAAEGIFRRVIFDWTTAYGLHPARALLFIIALWVLLIPVYWWPIWRRPGPASGSSGIFQIWPKDRVEVREGKPALDNPARIERLHDRGLASLGWSAYFSLLSAFHIGFREFSVGSWIARMQPRSFALEAAGWVRTVSGAQSLLSVYLLAMWVLTYFGRPFQ
jgi:uncharacterized protein YjbI with pentapeptide repeats